MKIRKLTKGNEVEEGGSMIVKAHIILTLKKLRLLRSLLLKILSRRPQSPSAVRPSRAPPSLNPARLAIPELPQMERDNLSNRHPFMPGQQKISSQAPLPPMTTFTQQNDP